MRIQGKVSYSSPSNIAIIKYWGKEPGDQIPMNPSLSMTLDQCRSFTTMEYEIGDETEPQLEVFFEGIRAHDIEAKLQRWFTKITYFFSWLKQSRLRVETHNNFPHSAGIASSASGMSAMAMCLAAIDARINAESSSVDLSLISNIARLGSGSASRSVMGPWVIWGKTENVPDANQQHAVVLHDVHPDFARLHDTIIVVDKTPKRISSRDGHTLMEGHPWRQGRIEQVATHMQSLLKALRTGHWDTFSKITENEALSLHALMLASEGGMMLWKGNTVEWMHYIREQRQQHNVPMTFTLDAGANIHLIYPDGAREKVLEILQTAPIPYIKLIHDHTGQGPEKLPDDYEA